MVPSVPAPNTSDSTSICGRRAASRAGRDLSLTSTRLHPRVVEVEHAARGLGLQVGEAVHRAVEVLRRDTTIGAFEQYDCLGAGPGEAGESGEDQKYLVPAVVERALDQINLDTAQQRQRHAGFLEPPLARELVDLGLAQPAVLHGGLDRRRGIQVVARDFAGLTANAADDLRSEERRVGKGVDDVGVAR